MSKPKAISLFSGAGGLDIGFSCAGFNVLASVEIDPACCDTLRENLKDSHTAVIETDIRKLDGRLLLRQFDLKVGELDCLFGGPPCQSFSLAGKRAGLDDERGMLLMEFFRLVDEIRPKVFVLENVKGMLNWSSGAVVKYIYSLFDRSGVDGLPYSLQHKCLDAADYGAPQFRQRAIFVGNRLNRDMLFPVATHAKEPAESGASRISKFVSVGDAILNLPPPTPPSKLASRISQTIKGRIERHGY